MKSLLQFLRQLQFWLCSGQMHYIHGADTLPPPLSAPEERAMLEALANGNTDAENSSLSTISGWWSTLQRNLNPLALVWKT